MQLQEIIHILPKTDIYLDKTIMESPVTGVCLDSRQIKPGNIFVAVTGSRVDGHDFINDAVNKGAIAIIAAKKHSQVAIPQIIVADPIAALGKIASYHRNSIHCPIIALTGSNGKTSVKEMIANILPKPAHATIGNLNNHIGVPLSLLQLNPEHRYAVFELGANHTGEIAYTSTMVRPHVALINNIAAAHIGEFGSIDAVAKAKGEIFTTLADNHIAVINEDDTYAHFWDSLLDKKQILRFSLNKPTDIYTSNLQFNQYGCANFELVVPTGRANINLQLPGLHHVHNALAAASCCYAVGITVPDIVQGLTNFAGVRGRLTFLRGINNSVIIDDSYNANLNSVLAAIAVLAKRPGYRILVLGDMAELGDWTEEHHKEVGVAAAKHGIDNLLTYGNFSFHSNKVFGNNAKHYHNHTELAQDLQRNLSANTTILVKGSRAMAMEKIVNLLVAEFP